MAISGDYPRPITVNGYVCRNCDDVSKARKFEDPSPPRGGVVADDAGRSVLFGGTLPSHRMVNGLTSSQPSRQALDRYA